ncbi:MAG: hypothetical protein ACOCZ8_00460 [Bacteroidota bacterium]
MKTFTTACITLLLSAVLLTGCQSEEEKLAAQGCACFEENENLDDAQKCLREMATETPKLKEDREYGMKIRRMIEERCPDAAKTK